MPEASALSTLIELAQDKADEAARSLQRLNGEKRQALEQLSTLQVYRQDYAERLLKAAETGLSASNYHNFRQFIATLDEAISQQNKVIAHFDLKIEDGQKRWQDEKRRLGSFEALRARQTDRQALLERRKEQRANDEISANIVRRAGNVH